MNASKAGKGGSAGSAALSIVSPAPPTYSLKEAQKFENTLLGTVKIPGAVVMNLSLNG